MPPPTTTPPDATQTLRLEASRVSFQALFPDKLNLPSASGLSAKGWNLSEYQPPAWLREGLSLKPSLTDSTQMMSQPFTLYPTPQYPLLYPSIMPRWWDVTPRHSSAGDPPSYSPQPIPPIALLKPKSFREFLEERVNVDWAKEKIARDPVLSKLPQFMIDQIKEGLPAFVVDAFINERGEAIADIYLEQHAVKDPATKAAVHKLVDEGTKYLLEGARWKPPVPSYIPQPDSNIPKAPPIEGSVEWYTKYSISFELWADFTIKKVSVKPFQL